MKHCFLSALLLFAGGLSAQSFQTPYEKSGKSRTATYHECMEWYAALHAAYPARTEFDSIGISDGGDYIGVFRIHNGDPSNKARLLVNNNIHPGEPEGTDASMLLVRELLTDARWKSVLDAVDLHIICQYNVDGTRQQSCCTRANQNGPENQGFRGNARNLDLNRDFIKCDSRNAKVFVRYFTRNTFDYFIDNHTSNGADYQYVLTYFHTRSEKLLKGMGPFIEDLDRSLHDSLLARGWPTAPYVETVKGLPDSGISAFWESGRYATGYAALRHCMGFTVETHMLKPFPQRVDATLAFMREFLKAIASRRDQTLELRMRMYRASNRVLKGTHYEPIRFEQDMTRWDMIPFLGYEHGYKKSEVTGLPRLWYDRNKPWSRNIRYYRYFKPVDSVRLPRYYVLPFAWHEVAERLNLNGISRKLISEDTMLPLRVTYITGYETVKQPYEGHYLHYQVQTRDTLMPVQLRKGDWIIPVTEENHKFLAAVLEPRAPDSYFAWNFFDAVLQQKEGFSDYVWADKAEEILAADTALKRRFEAKRKADTRFAADAWAQWDWIYKHSSYYERTHRLYPVGRID